MRKVYLSVIAAVILFLLGTGISQASPISEEQAKQAAVNWLIENPRPFGEDMGSAVKDSASYKGGTAGDIGYYLVTFEPSGWLILPADDRFWPTFTFGGGRIGG